VIHRWESRGERKEPKEMNGMGGIGKEMQINFLTHTPISINFLQLYLFPPSLNPQPLSLSLSLIFWILGPQLVTIL